jgi:aminoglycoside phosphotransferase (APT) family kinase protein
LASVRSQGILTKTGDATVTLGNPVIDVGLVSRLIADQFPAWTRLPVRPVANGGWDNRTFHLGDDMLVRMPSAERYAPQVQREQEWLPRLAPSLPVPIPRPLAMGRPSAGYPWHWSVYQWLPGEPAASAHMLDKPAFARDLAAFLLALHRVPTEGGPLPGPDNFYRGGPLSTYDVQARRAIADLPEPFDRRQVGAIWKAAVGAEWTGPPVWVHGDLAPSNLLVRDGRLSAVIDFGQLGVGDPACDLAIAWTSLRGPSREVFRSALRLDPPTWARGRAWAAWKAAILLSGLARAPRADIDAAAAVLAEVIADPREAA